MTFELSEIKTIRKQLNLTQAELAKAANVSQSLIAKIEANRLDPTFTNAKKIFQTLESFQGKKELKAEEIMNKSIISVTSVTTIKEAINLLKKHAISQVPVIDTGHVVGFISETIILNALLEQKGTTVLDIMQDTPPIITKKSSIDVVSDLLKFYQMVIVGDKGKVLGVITRSDVLKKI
jgi:predicted transcriptional regulator|tara:strand:- start:149 stop:685 length:537 start_codon:yes stop_codon:yes gene_type:complete